MLVTAKSPEDLGLFYHFLKDHGVNLGLSEDLRVLGRMSNGKLIGVVAYNGFNGRVCSMHIAGDGNWISREFIRATFTYPFITLDLVQVFGPVPADNTRALRLDRHFGFEVLYRVRYGWDHKTDLIMLGMHRSQCRWLKEKTRELQVA